MPVRIQNHQIEQAEFLRKLNDLIRRAEDSEEAPGGQTGPLIEAAAKLLLTTSKDRFEVFRFTDWKIGAYDQAALHLMREALPGWSAELHYAPATETLPARSGVVLHAPDGAIIRRLGRAEPLARTMFITTLRAYKQKEFDS